MGAWEGGVSGGFLGIGEEEERTFSGMVVMEGCFR